MQAHLSLEVDSERLRRFRKADERLPILELAGADEEELELVEGRKLTLAA